MENPPVSVVIITRNRAEDLLRCLRSIAAQDYTDIEIIVVDNGSTDNTIEAISAAYPAVTLLQQGHNTGAPEGRNIGIKHAKGELVLCVDDDAELPDAQTIRKSIPYFQKDPQLACLSFTVFDQYGQVVRKLIPRRDRKLISEDTFGAMFSATGCVMRRTAFLEVGGFWKDLSPYFGEEPELSYRFLDNGYHILLTPHIIVRHYESTAERAPDRRLYYGTRNTPWLALRNFPWYAVFILTTLSWGYFFLIAIRYRQLRVFLRAVMASIRHMPAVYRIRQPIKPATCKLLWKYSGLFLW